MNKRFAILLCLMSFGCVTARSVDDESVLLRLSYVQNGDDVVLGLSIYNRTRSRMRIPSPVLMIDGRKQSSFWTYGFGWAWKPVLPIGPKALYWRTSATALATSLGVGEHSMYWVSGRARSNVLVLRVNDDGSVVGVQIECDPMVKRFAGGGE